MKKILGMVILTILLSGCSNKIVCRTNSNSDDNVSMKYIIKYDDNSVTGVTTEKTYSFDTKDQFKNFESYMKYMVNIGNDDDIKTFYKKRNKKYILIQKYNVVNLSDNILFQNGLKKNKDELVNYLNSNGFICK